MKKLEIAVAGAGPAGLSTALYLSRIGHCVTLFERFEKAQPLGSGLLLQPTGLAVLHDLGVHARVTTAGQWVHRLIGHDAASRRVVLDVRYSDLPRLGCALGIHRSHLFDALHSAVVAARIPIMTGFHASALDPIPGGTWLTSSKGRREGPFDLVVDATGASSPLRTYAAKRSRSPRELEYGALWATTPWDGSAGFDPHALSQCYRRCNVMAGVMPTGSGTAAYFWSVKLSKYEALRERGFEALANEMRAHWPAASSHIASIKGFEDMVLARYAQSTLRVPAGERIAFVGDSAHSTSPQLGQGANMALLDARALALALQQSHDIAEALSRYAALRRWHVRVYQALSYWLTPLYQSDSLIMPVLRDVLIAAIARVPPVPQIQAAMVAGRILDPLRSLGLKNVLQ